MPDVAGQGIQVAGVEASQPRPELIAGIAVNAHSGRSAHTEKARGEVVDEPLYVEHARGRVPVTLVDVYVVAVYESFETQLTGLSRLIIGAYLAGQALKSFSEPGLTAASNTHETSVLMV